MVNSSTRESRPFQTRFSFGATSAIITNLALIVGLNTLAHPKPSIIGSMLVIALADNLSDSTGIHIYQESEYLSPREVWLSTLTNFATRVVVSLTFIVLVLALPIKIAVACSVPWGLSLLTIISYTIAKDRKVNPCVAMVEHIAIAIFVIIASNFAGKWAISVFNLGLG